MLFKKIIADYSENHARPINKNIELPIFKVAGTYSNHLNLKG
jgi:hypothetical protein